MKSVLTATAEMLDARRRVAELVNGAITLRAPWHVVRCVGRVAAVGHVQFDAYFQSGLLRRRKGELLCGAKIAPIEKAEAHDSAGRPYMAEVTCAKCLARARVLSNLIEIPKLHKPQNV